MSYGMGKFCRAKSSQINLNFKADQKASRAASCLRFLHGKQERAVSGGLSVGLKGYNSASLFRAYVHYQLKGVSDALCLFSVLGT